MPKRETILQCPHCGHRMSFTELKLAKYNYQCGCSKHNIADYVIVKGVDMRTVWVVAQGEKGEGCMVKGVFEYVKPARKLAEEIKKGTWFDPECDYVIVKEWLVNETL